MDYTTLWNEFARALFVQVKRQIERAGYDRTFKAQVKSRLPDGRYEVLYRGNYYAASSSFQLTAGQIVRVCAPQNNWNDLFILTGCNSSAVRQDI